MRKVFKKNLNQIVSEWDLLAGVRYSQISTGIDITFSNILCPGVLKIVDTLNVSSAIDAGCGVGFMTSILASKVSRVIGVDPSPESIKIAHRLGTKKINFICDTIENYKSKTVEVFDLVIANMVLMDVLNLESFISASFGLLKPGGSFVFSITHPCFWPKYYGYEDKKWFNYLDEIIIESPFRISNQKNIGLVSTHVHRPLSMYIELLTGIGFLLSQFVEPMPDRNTQDLYPAPWKFPRYLICHCFKP